MAAVTKKQQSESQSVSRPLKVLVPLIRQDIEEMEKVTDKVVSPYYLAVGEKLLEAKEQVSHGCWGIWLKENFKLSHTVANLYMDYSHHVKIKPVGFNLTYAEYKKNRKSDAKPQANPAQTQQAQAADPTAQAQAARRAEEERSASKKEKQLTLGRKVIDLGYKSMAVRLHPDKGGTSEDMHELQEVKKLLISSFEYQF
jgi:hypothetical protein